MRAKPQVLEGLLSTGTPLLAFESGLTLATVFGLDPLLLTISQSLVSLGGDPFVGNTALIGFVLSPLGALSIAMASVLVILLNAIEIGGAFLIIWRASEGSEMRLRAVARTLIARLPTLLSLSALAFVTLVALTVPVVLVALAAKALILSDTDIYYYLATRPPEFLAALALLLGGMVAAAVTASWMLVRYGLSVPICLLHDLPTRAALRAAAQATEGERRTLLLALLAWGASLVALYAVYTAATVWLFDAVAPPTLSLGSLRLVSLAFAIIAGLFAVVLARARRVGLAVVMAWTYRRLQPTTTPERTTGTGRPPPRHVALALICLALLIAAVAHSAWAFDSAVPPRRVAITAHRGGSLRAPENTLAALEQAIADGADFVEIDVQETMDGEVVLLHDTDLRRVAGVPRPIWQVRYEEIKDLDVGTWFAPRFAAEHIPTLRQFAAAARGRVRLNVELKVNGHEADLARRVLAVLSETGMSQETIISSLDLGILRQVRALAPHMPVGLVIATGVGDLRRLDVDFFALSRRWATPGRLRAITATGRQVHVWTLNDERSIAGALLNGADNIITSDTRLGVNVRRWYEALSPPERTILQLRNGLAGRDRLRVADNASDEP